MNITAHPHHVAFTVSNLEETARWYNDMFGFKVAKQYESDAMRMCLIGVTEGFGIELFETKENAQPLPTYRKDLTSDLATVGTKHLCLKVDVLDETIERLKASNAKVASDVDDAFFGGRYVFVQDPDGNLIELCEIA